MEPTNQPDFQHGYTSGMDGVERDTYEGYLSSQMNADWLTDRIQETRTELTRTEELLMQTTEANRLAFAQLQPFALRVEQLSQQVAQKRAERDARTAEREALRERRAKAAPEYSLLAGLLFLAAGISFLAGDLIISHEIVAYALNIRNSNEAWAFAVGLAMVSVLLKPAYDRLIEQPYTQNPAQNRPLYQRFKIGLAVFAVLTLAVLGWFRYEAYRTDQLKAAINKSVRQLQLSTDPMAPTQELSPATMAKIERQLNESSALNLALVDSPWALLSFVLSGILFALAGAVCLGIALPVLAAFWFRWLQADVKLGKIRRRLKRIERDLLPLENQLAEQRSQQQVYQHNLDLLPDLDVLHQRQQTLQTQLINLLTDLRLAQTDSRISNFNDGYSRGEAVRNDLTDDEQRQRQRDMRTLQQTTRPRNASGLEKPQPGKGPGLRPYQSIRKFLSDEL